MWGQWNDGIGNLRPQSYEEARAREVRKSAGGTLAEVTRIIEDRPVTKRDVEQAYKHAGYSWDLVDVMKDSETGQIYAIVVKDNAYWRLPYASPSENHDVQFFNLEDMEQVQPSMVDGGQAFGAPDDEDVESEPGKDPADGRGVVFRPTAFEGKHSGGGFSLTQPGKDPADGEPSPLYKVVLKSDGKDQTLHMTEAERRAYNDKVVREALRKAGK
jgi:hypothetical protein